MSSAIFDVNSGLRVGSGGWFTGNSNVVISGNLLTPHWSVTTGIDAWEYTGKFKSLSGEETGSTGIWFKPDGTKMFIIGSTGIDINEYALSTAWGVDTATFTAVSSTISATDTSPQDLFFKDDGLRVYVVGTTNDSVYAFDLTVAWDITSLNTTAVATKSVAAEELSPTALFFKSDGTKMYVSGTSGDDVNEYDLSVAWDITTASFLQVSTTITQDTAPGGMFFNADGTILWLCATTGEEVNQYNLSTAWNISTAAWAGRLNVGFQTADPTGIYVDTASAAMYITSSSGDAVYQYYTGNYALLANANTLVVSANARLLQNLDVAGLAYVQGAFGVQGTSTFLSAATFGSTLTACSTITLGGTTTTVTSLGTSATTGTMALGGTTQTGTITIGQSTGAQTLFIHSGVTTTGTQKQLILMGNGAAGSTSNLIIGPTVAVGNAFFQAGTPVTISNNTTSTSTTTGALVVGGGVGIAGDLHVAGNIVGAFVSTGSVVDGNLTVNGNIVIGTPNTNSYDANNAMPKSYTDAFAVVFGM